MGVDVFKVVSSATEAVSDVSGGVGNIGGSMDLALGARRLFITMLHTTRDGRPKIVGSFPSRPSPALA